jgi:hypothetical protein
MLDAGSRFLSIPDLVGLFRVHAAQKTSATWTEVGLPEIARVHARSGVEIDEGAMVVLAELHELGVAPTDPSGVVDFARSVNASMNGYRAALLGGRPLDRWWAR